MRFALCVLGVLLTADRALTEQTAKSGPITEGHGPMPLMMRCAQNVGDASRRRSRGVAVGRRRDGRQCVDRATVEMINKKTARTAWELQDKRSLDKKPLVITTHH